MTALGGAVAGEGPRATTTVERREAKRFTVNPGAVCAFTGPAAETAGPAEVLNVSTTGVGLLMARRVKVGTVLSVTLSDRAREFSKTVLVRVVHVGGESGGWVVGGAFDTPLTFEELTALVL
jgi:hypothetical protein